MRYSLSLKRHQNNIGESNDIIYVCPISFWLIRTTTKNPSLYQNHLESLVQYSINDIESYVSPFIKFLQHLVICQDQLTKDIHLSLGFCDRKLPWLSYLSVCLFSLTSLPTPYPQPLNFGIIWDFIVFHESSYWIALN